MYRKWRNNKILCSSPQSPRTVAILLRSQRKGTNIDEQSNAVHYQFIGKMDRIIVYDLHQSP
jgi:hypothetical protein